jgi:hypothetical protein
VGIRVSRRAGESSRWPLELSYVDVRLMEGRRAYPPGDDVSGGERFRDESLGMVRRGASGSGSSSTGLKRSAYPWAVLTERERTGRVGVAFDL